MQWRCYQKWRYRKIVVEQLPEKIISVKLKTKKMTDVMVLLGHIIGNRHRPISIQGDEISFPIQADSEKEIFTKLFQSIINHIEHYSRRTDIFPSIQVQMYMNIDEIEQELGVMQLSDSFFPTGIFTTSNGLEFLFTEKKIQDMADLIEIIRINITQQIGPSDCVALANAFDSANKCDFDQSD